LKKRWLPNKRSNLLISEAKLDPRVKRTRALLQQALGELVQEKPFGRITVQDIAARAEVNRATFYAHFEDKYALLNYALHEEFRERIGQKFSEDTQLTLTDLHCLILTTCDFLGEFLSHCAPIHTISEQAVLLIQVQVCIQDMLMGWLTSATITHASAEEMDSITMTTSWAIWGSVFQWARTGRKIPAQQLTDQILMLIVPGMNNYLVNHQ
jgi:AcrR family transcriptional regulator